MKKENSGSLVDMAKKCWKEDLWLKILTSASTLLIIISFFLPPTGIIDPSVMLASGELMGWGALWQFTKAMNRNINAKVKIKEIELELSREKQKAKEINTSEDEG